LGQRHPSPYLLIRLLLSRWRSLSQSRSRWTPPGQLIPTPEPDVYPDATPAEIEASLTPPALEPDPGDVSEEAVNPGLAMAAPAYNPPAGFEHTAFNPENVQHIS